MPNLNVYLIFNGNAREAMNFYKDAIGGELQVMSVGDSPMKEKMPPEMHSQVMHARLQNDALVLLASDNMGGPDVTPSTSVSLALNVNNVEEAEKAFAKLSEGGQVTMPLSETFWATRYGQVTDKYGFQWLVNLEKKM
ncbi:MAG TPA: VOC family protein [Chitinophaga sp.]|uniref:VOC family protein n=1 Tax=Chitinophaga sp. TaxID=1869181 RepID=UPI002C6C39A4|nr:VOC family protein [Chitinophaga sp.]HVI46977.1 VOC family protein [Chitinophaga sp.]